MTPTGWIFTDCVNYVDCPSCKKLAGTWCCAPSGKKSVTPHGIRVVAYRNSITKEEFTKRHIKKSRYTHDE